ncbi:hypothetical protein POTOM_035977 [Populus tomentosa]|uniref:Leucine-rich repeat-containing N-terminal plant-type domain-containing protein n=1 Tax=Populus tomentosa TaxID=118781 RepID=A0A8X7YZF0_POPTO|nr:hypothetical protein POTOM_035977 [Populus tomentosa]
MSCFLVLIFVRKFEHCCGTGSTFANIGEDRCPWKGVVCSRTSGHVIKLDLRNQFQLDELGIPYFDFYPGNYSSVFLKGIPQFLKVNFTSLELLDLCQNGFDSVIPPFSSIQHLDLSENAFHDPIPASLGRLSSLIQLSLGFDHLNGSIPKSFGQLSNLEVLDVSDNKLGGMVSELHFANLRHLTGLILSSNSFVINFAQHGCLHFSFKVSGCRSQFPQWLQSSNTKECWNFRNV